MKKAAETASCLLLICLVALSLACSGSNSDDETLIQVGDSRIKLIPYPAEGFHLIDESKGLEAYNAAVRVLGGGDPLLALYTDSIAWDFFVNGITSDGPQDMFPHAATISFLGSDVNRTASVKEFDGFVKLHIIDEVRPDREIIENDSRYVTYVDTLPLAADLDLKIASTLVLVQGKVLTLETMCLTGSPFEDKYLTSAYAWRDAYLKETKP